MRTASDQIWRITSDLESLTKEELIKRILRLQVELDDLSSKTLVSPVITYLQAGYPADFGLFRLSVERAARLILYDKEFDMKSSSEKWAASSTNEIEEQLPQVEAMLLGAIEKGELTPIYNPPFLGDFEDIGWDPHKCVYLRYIDLHNFLVRKGFVSPVDDDVLTATPNICRYVSDEYKLAQKVVDFIKQERVSLDLKRSRAASNPIDAETSEAGSKQVKAQEEESQRYLLDWAMRAIKRRDAKLAELASGTDDLEDGPLPAQQKLTALMIMGALCLHLKFDSKPDAMTSFVKRQIELLGLKHRLASNTIRHWLRVSMEVVTKLKSKTKEEVVGHISEEQLL